MFPDFVELLIVTNPFIVDSISTPKIRYWNILKDLSRKEFFNYVLRKASARSAVLSHGFNVYKDVTIECKLCRTKKHFRNEIDVYNFIEKHRKC